MQTSFCDAAVAKSTVKPYQQPPIYSASIGKNEGKHFGSETV